MDLTDEVRELVRELGSRFIARKDVKAFQRNDGAWFPDRNPFTMQDFRDHLAGTKTLGHYLLDENSNCKLFAFDIDLVKHGQNCPGPGCKGCPVDFLGMEIDPETGNVILNGLEYSRLVRDAFKNPGEYECYETLVINLRCMADGLARMIHRKYGIPVAIAKSGSKGLHVYGFTGEMPAEVQKQLALDLLTGTGAFEAVRGDNFWKHSSSYPMLEIEVFPKQTSLDGKDLGKGGVGIPGFEIGREDNFVVETRIVFAAAEDKLRAFGGGF